MSEINFQRHADSDLPLVVDSWAPWCGPCRQFAAGFENTAAELEPRVQLDRVNAEQEQALAQRYVIRSIPALMIFQQGREVNRISGALSAIQLK